jgi:hypothetical protein
MVVDDAVEMFVNRMKWREESVGQTLVMGSPKTGSRQDIRDIP